MYTLIIYHMFQFLERIVYHLFKRFLILYLTISIISDFCFELAPMCLKKKTIINTEQSIFSSTFNLPFVFW